MRGGLWLLEVELRLRHVELSHFHRGCLTSGHLEVYGLTWLIELLGTSDGRRGAEHHRISPLRTPFD